MPDKKWSMFKSGSDIRGFGISNSSEPLFLSDEVVSQITFGFALWLSRKINKNFSELVVSVGHDSRLSAQRIKKCVIQLFYNFNCKIGFSYFQFCFQLQHFRPSIQRHQVTLTPTMNL